MIRLSQTEPSQLQGALEELVLQTANENVTMIDGSGKLAARRQASSVSTSLAKARA